MYIITDLTSKDTSKYYIDVINYQAQAKRNYYYYFYIFANEHIRRYTMSGLY